MKIGGLHHAGAFGATKTHAGQHGKAAEYAVIACFGIVVKGGEDGFGEAGHVIG